MSWFSSRRPGAGNRPGATGSPAGAGKPGGPGGVGRSAGQPPPAVSPSPPAAAAAAPAAEVRDSHHSLALAALLASFAGREKLHLLDLGPAIGGNVEYLSRFGCKLYIQDLYPALAARQARAAGPTGIDAVAPWDRAVAREARDTWEARHAREDSARGESSGSGFGSLMSFADDTRFDAVLAWDLFNYLDRRELAELARQLARWCRPGALVLALISIQKQIPAEPVRMRILDDAHLAYEPRTASVRACPRYAPAELNELMRGFTLDRSYLMRHGIQEYLFAREPG